MKAKDLMNVLETCAHDTGLSLDQLYVEVWDAEWHLDDITSYSIDDGSRIITIERN